MTWPDTECHSLNVCGSSIVYKKKINKKFLKMDVQHLQTHVKILWYIFLEITTDCSHFGWVIVIKYRLYFQHKEDSIVKVKSKYVLYVLNPVNKKQELWTYLCIYLLLWLIDWCSTPTLTKFQLYCGILLLWKSNNLS